MSVSQRSEKKVFIINSITTEWIWIKPTRLFWGGTHRTQSVGRHWHWPWWRRFKRRIMKDKKGRRILFFVRNSQSLIAELPNNLKVFFPPVGDFDCLKSRNQRTDALWIDVCVGNSHVLDTRFSHAWNNDDFLKNKTNKTASGEIKCVWRKFESSKFRPFFLLREHVRMKYTYENRSVKFPNENDSPRKWQLEQCSNFIFVNESNSLIKFIAKMSIFGLFSPHIRTIFARVFEPVRIKNVIFRKATALLNLFIFSTIFLQGAFFFLGHFLAVGSRSDPFPSSWAFLIRPPLKLKAAMTTLLSVRSNDRWIKEGNEIDLDPTFYRTCTKDFQYRLMKS